MKSQGLLLVLTFVVAIVVVAEFFFSVPGLKSVSTELQSFGTIIGALAAGLASVNLLVIHSRRIKMRRGEWWNSLVLVSVLLIQTVIGFVWGSSSEYYAFGFDNLQAPLGATMYALLAFWVASAAYRAFTARSLDASLLLISAVIVLLGNAPIGSAIWDQFPVMKSWIMEVPNMAAQRGIMIGGAIGAIALGIRILMGIERGHLGGGAE